MRRHLLLLFSFLISAGLYAQKGDRWRHTWTELLVGAGPSRMFNDMDRNRWGIDVQAGARFSVHRYWTLKTQVEYTVLHGSDKETGFAYATWAVQPSAQAEFHFLTRRFRNIGYNRRELILREPKTTGYVFAGIGATYFQASPEDALAGVVDHRIKKIKPVLPLGLGYKHSFTDRFSLSAEAGMAYVRTDYLEAYASRAKRKFDRYFFSGLALTCKLNIRKMQSPGI